MKYSNVIEMDIWSNFGCFSKPFSNTGGILSFLIPPKTSIIGIIGAVLGYEFDKIMEDETYSIEELYDVKISVQPLFDLKSKRVTFNRVEGTNDKLSISNIHQDVLINPYYKLFISFPDSLKDEEKLFINRIKNHETIFSLYMGRNEFPLSFKLCNIFDYESKVLNSNNINDFFSKDEKIFGLLNRNFIKETELVSVSNSSNEKELIFNFNKNEKILKSFYEYIIREYPIKRTKFTEFTYSDVSFYAAKNMKDCYFSKFVFKDDLSDDQHLELTKIGENEWISLI
jgi:CRISPR-associated protein Cas5h